MRKHIFRSNIDKLISEGKDLLKEDVDMVLAYRISMVLLVLQGMPALQLAEFSDCEARTIQLWVDTVDKEGFDALRPQRKSGRHKKFDDKQKAAIKKALYADPTIEGYTVWDGITLSDYISKKYGISLSVRSCQRLFHELGFSQKTPQTHPYHGSDESAREGFKKN